MKIITEKELRAIDPAEFEDIDIKWTNKKAKLELTGRVLFDYDQGLSILDKENTERCLTGIHGPAYKGCSLYNKEKYHTWLSVTIEMLRKGYIDVSEWYRLTSEPSESSGNATCSFT